MYKKTEKSTQHGAKTPFGNKTPHRMPTKSTSNEDFLLLVNQLYPTGRAWYLPEDGAFQNLHKAINTSFIRLINNAHSLVDSTFPDNSNFNEYDADLWEYRLGLSNNSALTIEQRRVILLDKLRFPGNVYARQSLLYIESRLQAVGFNVKLYENTSPYRTPAEILSTSAASITHGLPTVHGDSTLHGGSNFEVIANSSEYENYSVGGYGNLWATFFIAGQTLNSFAVIPEARKKEFKELVLKLKPAEKIAFLMVNFI